MVIVDHAINGYTVYSNLLDIAANAKNYEEVAHYVSQMLYRESIEFGETNEALGIQVYQGE